MRILIGDTNHVQAQALKRILSVHAQAKEIVLLETGREVVRALAAAPFDVLVLDWNICGVDVLQLIRIVRRQSAHTFIILCSDRNDSEALRLAVEAGVDEYLLRPFKPTHLLAKVSAHLTARQGQA